MSKKSLKSEDGEKVKKKKGRPTKYSPELAAEICDAVASCTLGLDDICAQHDNFPAPKNIYIWMFKFDGFRQRYLDAKTSQGLLFAEETLRIASEKPFVSDKDGIVKMDSAHVAWQKMNVNLRQWHAAKLQPKQYGDKKELELTTTENEGLKSELLELKAKLDEKNKSEY